MVLDPSLLEAAAVRSGAPTTAPVRVIGVRSASDEADYWDDRIVLVEGTNATVMVATTDPGKVAPRRVEGTAILQPGFYAGMWAHGLHRGKYPAGVQIGPCNLWRDDVSDGQIRRGGPTYPGLFGINLHHGGDTAGVVGNWSEGCQVLRFVDDLQFILSRVPATFDYVLIDEADFPEVARAVLAAEPRTLPTLRRGAFGPDVVLIQRAIGVKTDGAFGRVTEAALKTWQSERGIDADGVVGRSTWAAIRASG